MNVLNPADAEAGSRARPTLAAAAVAALVLGSVLLAPTAAPAAVFDELTFYSEGLGYGDFDDPESPCEKPTIHFPEGESAPFEDNDARTLQAGTGLTVKKGATSLAAATWIRGTARATTKNKEPRRLRLDYSGTISAGGDADVRNCEIGLGSNLTAISDVRTKRPYWVTFSYRNQANASSSLRVDGPLTEWRVWSDEKRTGSKTRLLKPGDYTFFLDGEVGIFPLTSAMGLSTKGSTQIDFARIGSASSKPRGKALKYTSLKSSRSCSAHRLGAAVTKSKKKFAQISKVSWSLGGKIVKTLKGSKLKRGAAVKLKIADTKKASVKATVRLKSGKTLKAKATYLPCA